MVNLWYDLPYKTGETWDEYVRRIVERKFEQPKRTPTLHVAPIGIFGCQYQPRPDDVIVDAEYEEIKCG